MNPIAGIKIALYVCKKLAQQAVEKTILYNYSHLLVDQYICLWTAGT